MIIVSQDKRKIVKFDNIFYIDYYKIDGNYEIDANTDKDSVSLGYYKTEERAKEVLEEIMQSFVFNEERKYMSRFMNDEQLKITQKSMLYEMPKE